MTSDFLFAFLSKIRSAVKGKNLLPPKQILFFKRWPRGGGRQNDDPPPPDYHVELAPVEEGGKLSTARSEGQHFTH